MSNIRGSTGIILIPDVTGMVILDEAWVAVNVPSVVKVKKFPEAVIMPV